MPKNKLAIFDIDGTIFRKNLAFELINELSWLGIFNKSVRDILVKHYVRWLNHKGVYEEYRKALVDLYAKSIEGCKRQDIEKASEKIAPFYKDRTYIFANQLIKKLKKEGYHIIAISGSPSEVVEEYNKYLKFEKAYGTIYETDKSGFFTGKIAFDPIKDKGQVAKQYAAENNLTLEGSYGVGDTESDAKFLSLVENPIAFNPNENLLSLAKKNNWKIVVEKKDVIYQIN